MFLDLSSPRLVLAGNAYGECSGGGRTGMENVTSVVLHRVRNGWGPTPIAVCLAPAQFSCWSDLNRARIEAAYRTDPAGWAVALDVADAALAGRLPDRTRGADSYYALSLKRPAYWAKAPARHVYSDRWHSFWLVRTHAAKPAGPAVVADAVAGAAEPALAGGAA